MHWHPTDKLRYVTRTGPPSAIGLVTHQQIETQRYLVHWGTGEFGSVDTQLSYETMARDYTDVDYLPACPACSHPAAVHLGQCCRPDCDCLNRAVDWFTVMYPDGIDPVDLPLR